MISAEHNYGDDDEDDFRSRPPPPVPSSRPISAVSSRKDTGYSPSSKPQINSTNDTRFSPRGSSSRASGSVKSGNYQNSPSEGGGERERGERERGERERGERERGERERDRGERGVRSDSPGDDDNLKTPDATARYQKARYGIAI
jgi:hypothetical protein